MKVFLIVLAVLAVIIALVLSLTAEFTVVFDNGWNTKIKVLFIEKEIQLSKLLSFILFPEKTAEDVKEQSKEKKKDKKSKEPQQNITDETSSPDGTESDAPAAKKPNPIQKILEEDGVVGIMLLISNLLQTAGSAITTLMKGLHIYSLYVKMIIGGGDAADIGEKYGSLCGVYYPIKGFILNGMKVDQYDDLILPDFIAPRSEYEFQIIAGISVGLLVKVMLKAGTVFVVNLIKNK